MASIRKHGPSWQIRWVQPDGTWASRGGFRTRSAAAATAREIDECVASGRRWEPRDARPASDLRLIGAAYIQDCARRLQAVTVRGYARTIESYLQWLPSLSPSNLSRPRLLEYYDHLCATPARAGGATLGRPRAASTPVKRLSELHTWWTWAHDEDERWPGAVAAPRDLRLTMPAQPRVVAPTWAEMDAAVAASVGPHRRVAILLRFTGLRIQQVMRLRWDDVDLDARTLRIRPELGKSRAERVGRVVPLSAHLVAELAGWGVRDGWVVPTHRQPGPRERVYRSREMRAAWERAGVRPEVWDGRPDHAFRKGFRSGLKRLGGDSEAIEYLLGHDLGDGEEGTYTDPDALPLRTTIDLAPPLAEPIRPSGDPAMDTRWTRAVAAAAEPDEKRRLRSIRTK